jgi:hypothetical protein
LYGKVAVNSSICRLYAWNARVELDPLLLVCPCDPAFAALPCCPFCPLLELSSTDTSENLNTISSTCTPPLGVEFPVVVATLVEGAELPVAASLVASLWLGALAAAPLAVPDALPVLVVPSTGVLEAADVPCVRSCAIVWKAFTKAEKAAGLRACIRLAS